MQPVPPGVAEQTIPNFRYPNPGAAAIRASDLPLKSFYRVDPFAPRTDVLQPEMRRAGARFRRGRIPRGAATISSGYPCETRLNWAISDALQTLDVELQQCSNTPVKTPLIRAGGDGAGMPPGNWSVIWCRTRFAAGSSALQGKLRYKTRAYGAGCVARTLPACRLAPRGKLIVPRCRRT